MLLIIITNYILLIEQRHSNILYTIKANCRNNRIYSQHVLLVSFNTYLPPNVLNNITQQDLFYYQIKVNNDSIKITYNMRVGNYTHLNTWNHKLHHVGSIIEGLVKRCVRDDKLDIAYWLCYEIYTGN